jgi:hypothetical protein
VSFEQRIKSLRLRAVRIQAVFERFLHATTSLTKPGVLNSEKGGVMRLPPSAKADRPRRVVFYGPGYPVCRDFSIR